MRDRGPRGTRWSVVRLRRGESAAEKGVGARAVESSSRSGLAGILFWSRGRVGRASGEAPGYETWRVELRAHSGKGLGGGTEAYEGALNALVPPGRPRLPRSKGRQ